MEHMLCSRCPAGVLCGSPLSCTVLDPSLSLVNHAGCGSVPTHFFFNNFRDDRQPRKHFPFSNSDRAQGLAFATVSGIPLLFGLYIVWAPPFFYSLFGVSLHVSYGPFALVGLFIRDALDNRGYHPCNGLCRHDTEETKVSQAPVRVCVCLLSLPPTAVAGVF